MRRIRRHVLPWSVAFFVLGFLLLYLIPSFSRLPSLVDDGVRRVILTAVIFVMIWLLGGASVLRPSLVGVRSTLREARYPVVVSLVLCAINLAADAGVILAYDDACLSPAWLLNILEALFLCVFVGLFEEGLVRVLLFCGILSRGGGSRNGMVAAALISSLVFGAIHVLPVRGVIDDLTLAQMLLKTVQAALIGLLLASAFLRTHSYYGVALVHCLADFLLFVPEVILSSGDVSGGYVSQAGGIEAVVLVGSYVLEVALYTPAVVTSMRLLDEALVPDHGCFVEDWTPRETVAMVRDASPTPPEGFSSTPASPVANQFATDVAPRRQTPHYPPEWPRS